MWEKDKCPETPNKTGNGITMARSDKTNVLSDQRQAFVEHYCTDANWNGAEAARMAGYSPNGADACAGRLLGTVSIQEAVAKKKAKIFTGIEATAEEVLRDHRLAKQISLNKCDIANFTRNNEDMGKTLALYKDNIIDGRDDTKPMTEAEKEHYAAMARKENVRISKQEPA